MKESTKAYLVDIYNSIPKKTKATCLKFYYQYHNVNVNVYFDAFDNQSVVLSWTEYSAFRSELECAVFLCTGMLIFLVISTFIPNIQHLRLHTMPRHNVFTVLVSQLWQTDTPTNLFPSIHVYNSLGAHFAVMNNETLSGKKWVRRGSLILCVSIILSTMFIKQHSMFDVLMAFIMGAVMYAAVYYYDVVGAYRFQTGKRQRKRARIG